METEVLSAVIAYLLDRVLILALVLEIGAAEISDDLDINIKRPV